MSAVPADPRLIVGLDLPSREAAERLVETLGDGVSAYKVGYQLAFSPGGPPLVADLAAAGKSVFLDLKLLDISNTVEKGVESALRLGAAMLTVHAYPHAMRAAAKAAAGTGLLVLGVTVLTSLEEADLAEIGYADTVETLVERRARQALDCGIGGIVASAQEAAKLRRLVGPDMAIVTPGIRPVGAAAGDQKRIVTPGRAIADGASHLVVARPVTEAPDPRAAVASILAEMREADRARTDLNKEPT